jgi:methylated-DNA-protein-cysteine methyltransferase-like protein
VTGKIFKKIYNEVRKIPRGQVTTYGEIAKKAGTTPRVVGFALHQNSDPKNIPCHRIVFKDGSLSPGYVFGGSGKQKILLEKEGINFDKNNKVKFC